MQVSRIDILAIWPISLPFKTFFKTFFKNKDKSSNENLLIGIYHADSPDYNKEKSLKSLTSSVSSLPRVVIATSAIGCWINARDLSYVCHFGPSHSLVDYCQQIGRAGRNGECGCHAVLYVFPGCARTVDVKMKKYIKSDTCLKTLLFSPFNESNTSSSLGENTPFQM